MSDTQPALPGDDSGAPRDCVAIWVNTWLGRSETFILNQMANLLRNDALSIGLFTSTDPLVVADYAPYRIGPYASAVAGMMCRGHVPRGYRSRIRKARATLVHAHYGPDAVVAAGIARRLDLPLVTTFHGYDATAKVQADAKYRAQLSGVFERSTVIVAVSDFIAAQLVGMGAPEHKLRRHYIGIPMLDATPVPTRREGIAFVGRFVEKKGVDHLLNAVALLPDELRDTRVRLIGTGPMEAQLRDLAQAKRLNVEFVGMKDAADVAVEMRSAQVFCAPSRTASSGDAEGLGMVFLEAARAGTPVVSYRHGGLVEAVVDGQTGLLVDENAVEDLSSALTDLLRDSGRARQMGDAARERVHSQFDIVETTPLLEDIYDEARELHRR